MRVARNKNDPHHLDKKLYCAILCRFPSGDIQGTSGDRPCLKTGEESPNTPSVQAEGSGEPLTAAEHKVIEIFLGYCKGTSPG